MRNILWACMALFVGVQSLNAQFEVGQWRDHLPYDHCIDIADGGDVIYVATESALFIYNRLDNSVERVSKANKLSDSGVSAINYNAELDVLVVGFTNGNVDLLYGGEPLNLPDIKRSSILADKTINDIYFRGNDAMLSCGFGIVVLDLTKAEVADTYMLGPGGEALNVNALRDDGSEFWAATDDGMYSADVDEVFLANFQNWYKRTDVPAPDSEYDKIEINSTYYLIQRRDTGQTHYAYFKTLVGTEWMDLPDYQGENKRDLYMDDEVVMVTTFGVLKIYDMDFQDLSVWGGMAGEEMKGNGLLHTPDGGIWVANEEGGLIGWFQGKGFNLQPDGPLNLGLRRIEAWNDNLWVASGGADGAWVSLWNNDGVYGMVDGSWINLPLLDGQGVADYMEVAINPQDPSEVFLGSWVDGLIHLKDGDLFERYNETNSTLNVVNFGSLDRIGIAGLDFDTQGNLWITNSYSEEPLHLRTPDGNFKAFNFTPEVPEGSLITEVLATQQGYVWVLLSNGDGLLVLDYKDTLTDSSDDESVLLTTEEGEGGLPVEWVNCMEEDLDGEIWVGTLQGPAIFYSPEAIFTGENFDAQQILIEQDGNVQILLETENITSIEIDGANRKWMGTTNSGVYLLSEDGTRQIYHFTAENSPLLSNNVLDIAINHSSGEVFFATARGIISFLGDATNFYEEMDNVSVFPNPVHPDYEGLITIDGLSQDADVKIADVSGNVVYQTQANGGRATWDGRNFNGARVSTGVYMVFVATSDGSSTTVSKVAFIN